MPPVLRRFLSLLLLLTLPGMAHAGFRNFGARDGLPPGEIFQIESWDGKILFATPGGLVVYDGVRWRTWDESAGLAGRTVQSLWFASDGSILLSGEGGIARWDGEDTFVEEVPQDPPEFGDLNVFEIAEATDGTLWCLGNSGLARDDGTGWVELDPPGAAGGINYYRSLHCATDGSVWVGTIGDGVYRLRDGAWSHFVTGLDFPGSFVSDIAEDAEGGIWISTNGGAARFDGAGWTNYGAPEGLLDESVIYSYQDSRGAMWFAGNEGFTRWDGEIWTAFGPDDGLPVEGGACVGEGPDGAIWLGLRTGASRFDLSEWSRYTAADGLAADQTYCAFEDAAGDIWVGGLNGTSRWDGTGWHTLSVVAPPPGNLEAVLDITQDAAGRMWFATAHGLAIRDGLNWTGPLDASDGFASSQMNQLLEDSRGRMWVANAAGVSRLDGSTWTHWEGGVDFPFVNQIQQLAEDSRGAIWIASDRTLLRWTETAGFEELPTPNGEEMGWLFCVAVGPDDAVWVGTFDHLYRYDDPGWTRFTSDDGLVGRILRDLLFDRTGALWIATEEGLGRLQDGTFGSYVVGESDLPVNTLFGLHEDSRGAIWMNGGGVIRHVPDRAAPVAIPITTPPGASSSRLQTVTWDAAYKEGSETVYQLSFDGAPWSEPTSLTVWTRDGLGDGEHELRVRGIDQIGNVQSPPTEVIFTVDATPPVPVITGPAFGAAVAGTLPIRGTADDPRFVRYTLEIRGIGEESWTLLSEEETPVADDLLGVWDTTNRPEGDHQIRIRVVDDVDLVGTVVTQVLVDNLAPFAAVTSPVRMTPDGGEVYSAEGEARIYVPPGAFAEETQVRLELASDGGVPGTLPDGATRVWSGVDLSWGTASPSKEATLDLLLPGDPEGTPAVYAERGDGVWEFLGGTWDRDARTLSLPVQRPGLHAVFAGGSGISVVPRGLGPLTLTPRVLRPGGQPLTIGFSLERESPVTVRVYNRAGRLVRTVVRDTPHGAGLQAVRWDGRDEGGGAAEDGLYLISVEALGSRQTRSVAVAR